MTRAGRRRASRALGDLARHRRRQRARRITRGTGLLFLAALVGGTGGYLSLYLPPQGEVTARASSDRTGTPLGSCRAIDGDTLACGAERIRLVGIDAPKLPGHCRKGRACAPGDPVAATRQLRAAMEGPLRIERLGTDRYGRTLGLVAGARGDLSCWQLAQGAAIYRPRWDEGGRLAAICPEAARS